jgi:hypothetical protein
MNAPPAYAPSGTAELSVALLTGPTLAPATARFAVDLRSMAPPERGAGRLANRTLDENPIPAPSW